MTNNKKKYIPELRFPEFQKTMEWSSNTMEAIFEIKNGYTPSKANSAYWDKGTIPWFRMEDIRKNGHILSDSIQHITPIAVKNTGLFPADSIILATTATIGEHALITVDSLANQRFTILTRRKSFEKELDMMFFHYFMFIVDEWCKRNTNAGGLLSVNMDSFKKLTIPYPASLVEQKKIANCFISIDKLIDATKYKLEQLKLHKKGLMRQLFPAPGKNIPELRFPKFSGEWQEKRLGEVANKVNTKNTSHQVSRVLTNSAHLGVVDQGVYFDRDIAVKENIGGYSIVEFEDFVYNPRISTVAPVGPISINKVGLGIMSPLYTIFRFHTGYIPFYEQYFQTTIWHDYLKNIANFGARFDRMNITVEGFFNMPLYLPSYEEQKKIVNFLSKLDNLIATETKLLESLKSHKKGLMQRLFPE